MYSVCNLIDVFRKMHHLIEFPHFKLNFILQKPNISLKPSQANRLQELIAGLILNYSDIYLVII